MVWSIAIISATYFGYFKMMEIISIKDTKLFNYVFQKADLIDDVEYI